MKNSVLPAKLKQFASGVILVGNVGGALWDPSDGFCVCDNNYAYSQDIFDMESTCMIGLN